MLRSSATAAECMAMLEFDFSLIGQSASDFVDMSATYIIDDGIIKNLNITTNFASEVMLVSMNSTSTGSASINNPNNGYLYKRGTAYEYFISLQSKRLLAGETATAEFKPYKAEITRTVWDETAQKYMPESYTVFATLQNVTVETTIQKAFFSKQTDDYFVIVYTAVLSDGRRIHNYRANVDYMCIEDGGVVTEIKDSESDYQKYSSYFNTLNIKNYLDGYENYVRTVTNIDQQNDYRINIQALQPDIQVQRQNNVIDVTLQKGTNNVLRYEQKYETWIYDADDLSQLLEKKNNENFYKDFLMIVNYEFDEPTIPKEALNISIEKEE